MKKHWYRVFILVVTMIPAMSTPLAGAWAQEPVETPTSVLGEPTVEPTGKAPVTTTPEPTASPTPTATSPAPASPRLELTGVEPGTLAQATGGMLSVYGSGFSSGTTVRLIGYGLLATTCVNGSALTAQAPAGVPIGTYDLEVSDGTTSAVLSDAVKVLAPTPTPKPRAPEKPPLPGRPILTVRNYAVEPAQVRPGQEFLVTIQIYNNGSRAAENALAIFPGDPFLPVGEPGHTIGQIHINHIAVVAQPMRAPSSLGPGIHQLPVNLAANDWEGSHYDYVQQVPVEVVGGGGTAVVVGKPRVVVEGASTEPELLSPGEAFTLTVQLGNRGRGTAHDIIAEPADSDTAILMVGTNSHAVDTLKVYEEVTLTLPLLLGEIENGGRQVLPLSLGYSDGAGAGYSDEELVVLEVDAGLRRSPQLVLAGAATQPDFLTPGDIFTLTMTLLNVGSGDAERLTLSLGGEGGAYLEPVIPLGAGNVLFIERLEAGASTTVSRQLIVDGAAETKAYNLPIGLAYDDEGGVRHDDVQRLSLVVRRRPELQATFYREPESTTVGSGSSLSLELINVGTSAVNLVALTASSPQMEVEAEGTPFIGPVEIGGSAPLDLMVTPRQGGPAELVISAAYRDDFNQVQVLTRTLTLEVAPGSGGATGEPLQAGQPPQEEPPQTVWRTLARAIRGFLGFGS